MKILYIQHNGMHHKNQNSINNYKNIEFVSIHSPDQLKDYDLRNFDAVFIDKYQGFTGSFKLKINL